MLLSYRGLVCASVLEHIVEDKKGEKDNCFRTGGCRANAKRGLLENWYSSSFVSSKKQGNDIAVGPLVILTALRAGN